MRKQIAQNKRNTVITILVFVVFITAIAGIFAWFYQSPSVLITAGIISIVYAFIQYFFADKLALLSTGARQIDQNENPRYYKIVQQLADENSLPMPKVYIMDDPAPNAFATGRDPQHACVAATTGLGSRTSYAILEPPRRKRELASRRAIRPHYSHPSTDCCNAYSTCRLAPA